MGKIDKKIKEVDDKYYEESNNLIDKKWKEIAKIQEITDNYRMCKSDIDFFREMVDLAPNLLAIICEFLDVNTLDELLKKPSLNVVIDPDIYSWTFFTSIDNKDFIYKSMEFVLGTEKVEKCLNYYNDYASSLHYDIMHHVAPVEKEIDYFIDEYVDFIDTLADECYLISNKLSPADILINNKYNNMYSLEEYVRHIDLGTWMLSLFIIPYYTDEERRKILKKNVKKVKLEMKLDRG